MSQTKIVSQKQIVEILSQKRKRKLTVGFTNGCFDILHFGHVSYLQKAKKGKDLLIVGLNSDASVRRIKGPQRPINSQRHRASVLAALECVDYVVIFSAETPLKLIQSVRPDVLIKGADWKGKGIVGEDFVKSYGGRAEFIKFEKNCSTTNVIEKILATCSP